MRIKTGNVALLAGLAGLLAMSGSGPASAAAGLTKNEARRVATAGLVKPGDLPKDFAAKATTAAEAAVEDEDEAAFFTCLGVDAPTFVIRKKGPKFGWADKKTEQSVEVRSGADITGTAEAAIAYQTGMRSAKAVGCYKQRLVNSFTRTEGVTVKSAQVDLLEATVAGADDAWAYGIKFVVNFKDKDIVGDGYLVGTRVGEVLGAVGQTGQGKEIAFADVTALAAKPVARAKEMLAKFAAKAQPGTSGQPAGPAEPAPAPAKPAPVPAKPAPVPPKPAPVPVKPAPAPAQPQAPGAPAAPGRPEVPYESANPAEPAKASEPPAEQPSGALFPGKPTGPDQP